MAARTQLASASFSVVGVSSVEKLERPEAPGDLEDEQAEEWRAIVGRMPADWFPRETHGLLSDYCRHVVRSRRVAQLISAAEDEEDISIIKLDRLYKMAERESRAASSLATRLRITQQSSLLPKVQKPLETKKPWDR